MPPDIVTMVEDMYFQSWVAMVGMCRGHFKKETTNFSVIEERVLEIIPRWYFKKPNREIFEGLRLIDPLHLVIKQTQCSSQSVYAFCVWTCYSGLWCLTDFLLICYLFHFSWGSLWHLSRFIILYCSFVSLLRK